MKPFATELMQIRVLRDTEYTTVLSVHGDADLNTAQRLAVAIERERGRAAALVVDRRAVTFMGSAGLKVLVKAEERAGPHAAPMRVVSGPPIVRLLELLGLHRMFDLYPDLDAALGRVRHELLAPSRG
jgi:anti-sigma B factor antagonist